MISHCLQIFFYLKKIVAAFQGMDMSPAKHSFVWPPRKCDYRTDTQTDGQTDIRRTKWSLCAAMLRRQHKNDTFCDITLFANIYLPCIGIFCVMNFWLKMMLGSCVKFSLSPIFAIWRTLNDDESYTLFVTITIVWLIQGACDLIWKLKPHELFPIYGMYLRASSALFLSSSSSALRFCCRSNSSFSRLSCSSLSRRRFSTSCLRFSACAARLAARASLLEIILRRAASSFKLQHKNFKHQIKFL